LIGINLQRFVTYAGIVTRARHLDSVGGGQGSIESLEIMDQLKGEGGEDKVEVATVPKSWDQKKDAASRPSADTRSLTVWAIVDLPVPASPFSQKTGDRLKSSAHDPILSSSLSCPFEAPTAATMVILGSLRLVAVVQY